MEIKMIMENFLYVLPGAGSPYNENYKKVYETIIIGGKAHNYKVNILDYCGFGQFPDYGEGLSLPTSLKKVRNKLIDAHKNSTLLGRCYGCNVIINMLASEPEILNGFSKIVLWGVASNEVWDNSRQLGVNNWNKKYKSKGVQLEEDFFATLNYVELDAKEIKHNNIVLGYGTKDNLTSKSFNERIAKSINNSGGKARAVSINGAGHGIIKDKVSKEITNQYFELIFKD